MTADKSMLAEIGSRGGTETLLRFGPQRCPLCGHLPEKSDFHVENGIKGGLIGGRITAIRYKGKHSDWGKMGGRGNKKEVNIG